MICKNSEIQAFKDSVGCYLSYEKVCTAEDCVVDHAYSEQHPRVQPLEACKGPLTRATSPCPRRRPTATRLTLSLRCPSTRAPTTPPAPGCTRPCPSSRTDSHPATPQTWRTTSSIQGQLTPFKTISTIYRNQRHQLEYALVVHVQ